VVEHGQQLGREGVEVDLVAEVVTNTSTTVTTAKGRQRGEGSRPWGNSSRKASRAKAGCQTTASAQATQLGPGSDPGSRTRPLST
jgi:hypothetical protein